MVKEINELKDMIDSVPTSGGWVYMETGNRSYGKSYVQNLLDEKDREIERLNNVIKNLNSWLEEQIDFNEGSNNQDYLCAIYSMVYCKLQEFKELKQNI